MATTGSGVSVPSASFSGAYTLDQLIGRWRVRLDDTLSPYLWSNDELTEYADYLQKLLFSEMPIGFDKTTAGICSYALVQGDTEVAISPRIRNIIRARLASSDSNLQIQTSAYMDGYRSGWDHADVEQGTPYIIVTEGVGADVVRLYPPLLAATDTLELVVLRMPLSDLDYTADAGNALEIDKYAYLLTYGIMWQAYLKQDADTYDPRKAEAMRVLWEGANGRGGDKEKIRRAVYLNKSEPKSASPMVAFQ